ncbi:Uncharacterised protein [Moraxella lacunata]|uniref:Uncharacterized protein n=1 Tax=Moraxella lacunata TaxID=477 RepID=A0A378TRN2_MORLA|nr:hypothetical protein [Moraxella lacunata]STZ63515.1 Uncharacterised protein [Moraxella lacunata]
MNYNRPIIITLLAVLSLCSVLARADEMSVSYKKTTYPALNDAVQKRGLFDDSIQLDTERLKAGSKVTLSKNYPVVPYDPNHPNVKKQSTFNIKANAKTLAGRFARGINSAALAYAVVDLLGDGIDWVLDPNNNSIKYYHPDGYLWLDHHQKIHPSKESAANYNCKIVEPCISVKSISVSSYNPDVFDVYIVSDNPSITTAPSIQRIGTTKEQSMPLDTIANHVINNEDNSTTNVITNNYYNTVNETIIEQIEKGEHDNDIDTALRNVSQPDDSTSPNDKTDNKEQPSDETKPKDESKPFELPAFCDWAGKVCDFIDWVKKDDTDKDTDIDISPDNIQNIDSSIRFSGQCPSDVIINGSFAGKNFEFFNFKWHKFCEILSYIKYIIVSMASYQAVRILGGVNVND